MGLDRTVYVLRQIANEIDQQIGLLITDLRPEFDPAILVQNQPPAARIDVLIHDADIRPAQVQLVRASVLQREDQARFFELFLRAFLGGTKEIALM